MRAIPDNITYGAPEICRRTYWRPARWLIDSRWRWPETPEPLPAWELRAIDVPLLSKRITRYNERMVSR